LWLALHSERVLPWIEVHLVSTDPSEADVRRPRSFAFVHKHKVNARVFRRFQNQINWLLRALGDQNLRHFVLGNLDLGRRLLNQRNISRQIFRDFANDRERRLFWLLDFEERLIGVAILLAVFT